MSVNILAFLPKRIREMSEYGDRCIYMLETGIIECDISSTLCTDTLELLFLLNKPESSRSGFHLAVVQIPIPCQ